MAEDDGEIVVKKDSKASNIWILAKKYGGPLSIILVLIIIVSVTVYLKSSDGFSSPDGVVARRSQRQIRSDTEVDRTWNLKELERSVALLNRDK
jgi:hypothetical protein